MNTPNSVNIGKDFSRFPAGRHKKHGSGSGEEFRDRILVPLLNAKPESIRIELDDAIGYGSSFLEEAFGGLVRLGFAPEYLLQTLSFVSEDLSLVDEIKNYISEAA